MQIAKRLLFEIKNRLSVMMDVGLGYLSLNRISNTLSGGESQRINLTRTLGSNLTNSMYILDEPSVGLHPRDTARLILVLKKLRNLGNTVIVVEHEEEVIKNADFLVDMGPGAGIHGGEVVYAGPYKDIFLKAKGSLTTKYMNGQMSIPVPEIRRKAINRIEISKANLHNLKNISVTIPLNAFTVISGVSGSGKTTLVKDILQPLLKKAVEKIEDSSVEGAELRGDFRLITGLECINQSPIGKSSRSNPVTYVKAYDAIRKLMSEQALSRIRGFEARHFSFNTDGGRCEACQGEGSQLVEMQFLADVHLICEDCKGKRFKDEVLDVQYHDKNIFDILEMSIEEGVAFFQSEKEIARKLQPLIDVGLGYVKMGQSSSSLSGGEAQRVKLASFLGKENNHEHIFFIFDEPTTGLHFHDNKKLLDAMQSLVERGHTVLVVEHNMDIIKSADWVIDLGPDAGKRGGEVVYQGTPEGLLKVEKSFTARYLKEKL
jgi:excinuclease ABC subunit A